MNCIIFVFSFLFDMKSDAHMINMTFYLYKCSNNNLKKKCFKSRIILTKYYSIIISFLFLDAKINRSYDNAPEIQLFTNLEKYFHFPNFDDLLLFFVFLTGSGGKNSSKLKLVAFLLY